MDLTLPTPHGDSGSWGEELNAALLQIAAAIDALNVAVTEAQSSADAKMPLGSSYSQAEADVRFIRTVNGSAPVNGNIQVSPEPGLQVIRQAGADYPLRATRSTDLTQPVIWAGSASPFIGTGYAVDNVDIWWQTP